MVKYLTLTEKNLSFLLKFSPKLFLSESKRIKMFEKKINKSLYDNINL